MSTDQPPIELPTIEVKPNGAMAGRTIRMRYPSVRLWLAQERGQLDNPTMYEEILDAIEGHDLGRAPASLSPRMVVEIGEAWLDAIKAVAIPPPSGND